MKDLILQKLKEHEWFRERKNRTRGFAMYLKDKYNVDVEVSRLQAIIEDSWSMDRAWRKALQDNPKLRGSDYDQKTELSQEKQIELGYESRGLDNIDI